MQSFSAERYARQIALPEVGPEGQAKLARTRVLLIGAGGLGSPAALYLAAAGIGHLGLVDPDTVALSNLQRQILYQTQDLNQPKVTLAAQKLQALNPEIQVQSWQTSLNPGNALELIAAYDLVLDGSDNLSTRYLLNDVCRHLGKPLVYGSVYRFSGQIASFGPPGACYRCLYPQMPPPGSVPSCTDAGVLGILPGLVGTLQASEILRLVLGWGSGLSSRLLMIDLKELRFDTLEIPRQPDCKSCAQPHQAFSIRAEDYPELLCRPELSAEQALAKLRSGELQALDVRTATEYQQGALASARNIPVAELRDQLHTLNPEQGLLVYCQKGQRSAQAIQLLQADGFKRIWSLKGGYEAWLSHTQGEIP